MNIHSLYRIFFIYFRPKRMRKLWQSFCLTPESRVLDVGGYEFNWQLLPQQCHVTFLNLALLGDRKSNSTWIIGDGKYLPFKDASFDVVYSNSVIEHLGNFENQRLFASECSRVGRRFYIQTPDKRFFVEPHLITPFIHWLPRGIQKLLLRNFTVWGLITRPTSQYCESFMNEVRLLNKRDLKRLFPDADIVHERFLGLSKSLIAVKGA